MRRRARCSLRPAGWTALLAAVVAAHALAAPFTKVEESFNLQAVHDLLYHGPLAVSKFDHLEFPGVVARTFLGALAVAGAAAPLALPLHAAGLPKLAGLLVVRLILVGIGTSVLGNPCAWLTCAHAAVLSCKPTCRSAPSAPASPLF